MSAQPSQPAPEPPATAPTRPADRYGDRPSRRGPALVALAVAGALFVAWVIWAGAGMAGGQVRWTDVGYRVVDDTTVQVTFSVSKDPGATAVCTIEALNERFAQVGLATDEVGPADQRAVLRTVTVRTAERAVTGVVESCRAG